MKLLEKATEYAFNIHKGQVRKASGIPYVNHLCDVTNRVSHYVHDFFDNEKEEILTAAMLHDSIEDCDISYDSIKKEFGESVANIVLECSRDPGKESKVGKFEFLESFKDKSFESTLIKIADRYCNVFDYFRTPGKKWYASIYALQAYPLYQNFFYNQPLDEDAYPIVKSDIKEIQTIVSLVFNINVKSDNNFSLVRRIVT